MALTLRMAIRSYNHTRPLKDGRTTVERVNLDSIEVNPIVAAYRRMVRGLEYDVAELAATTYLCARAHGAAFTALPIFLFRGFHHGDVVCRADSGIREPRDLEGRKVGIRAWTVTTGVWARGILHQEYGLDLDRVTWVTDDEEHVLAYRPPPNVIAAPAGRSLAAMLAGGELDAALSGAAGIGRSGPPRPEWATATPQPAGPGLRPLIPEAGQATADWYRRTGIYPLHGLVVVKDSLLAEHPWLAETLYRAFVQAKHLAQAGSTSPTTGSEDERLVQVRPIVGADPLPYGIEPNRTTLSALLDYAYQQQIIPTRPPIEELFASGRFDPA